MRIVICAARSAFSSSARFSLLLFSAADSGGSPATEAFRADHQHRRPRVDVVGGRAAQARDQRARVAPPERAQFPGEDDDLSVKRPGVWQIRRG